jgi:ribosomal protein L37AE/L43A
MTTIEETPTEPERCPKCGTDGEKVPEVDVWHCDACGKTWGPATTTGEVLTPEVVEPTVRSEALVSRDHAVERMADAALEMPEIPGKTEFMALAMMARTLAGSGIIPSALRGKPADVLVVLLTARDLQIPATTALSQIHVIDGKPTLSPKLLSARVQRMGMGRIVQAYKSESLVLCAAVGPGRSNIDQRCVDASVAAIVLGKSACHWTGDDHDQ